MAIMYWDSHFKLYILSIVSIYNIEFTDIIL